MKLEGFKEEIRHLFEQALLALTDEEYEELSEYAQKAAEGQV